MSWPLQVIFCFLLSVSFCGANPIKNRIIVSKSGNAGFTSIQGAISSMSDSASEVRTVFIKNGIYNEKIYIEKHNIILEGESREGVVISYASAREEWRCDHADDWGVAPVNIDGNDITLKNLTVKNTFGFDWKADKTISCATDSTGRQLINRTGHQMAVRTMKATRFKAINCHIISYAGDALSPWNVQSGMFYFKNCTIEGGVDLYCPRGFAFAESCTFIAHRGDAILWHDGSLNTESKTVLKSCLFDGYAGFNLGRYHKDSQFYLIACTFSANMSDKKIYRVETRNEIKWGDRVYYHNCHKTGGDLPWFANNFPIEIKTPETLNEAWVFGTSWNPVKE